MRYPAVLAALILALVLAPFQTTASPKGTVTLGTPIITPAPKTAQVDGAEQAQACQVIARWTLVACAQGFKANGGKADRSSPEFQFASTVCLQASHVANAGCMANLLKDYIGSTKKGECADFSSFLSDSINASCQLVTQDPAQRKKCESWASAGTASFTSWCQSKQSVKTKPEKSDETTAL